MKFIKFSFLLFCFTLFSCDEFYDNLFDNDTKSYSCTPFVTITNWTKNTNECFYIFDYNNLTSMDKIGRFQVKYKNPKNGYSKLSNEIRIVSGENSVKVQIENCKSGDDIVEVCFISY